jgi:hypothetical protein
MTKTDFIFPDPFLHQIIERLEHQPEEVRGVFLRLLCREMQERGVLELRGVNDAPGEDRMLVYKDPRSGYIYEIADSPLHPGEERLAMEDLNRLMEEVRWN